MFEWRVLNYISLKFLTNSAISTKSTRRARFLSHSLSFAPIVKFCETHTH